MPTRISTRAAWGLTVPVLTLLSVLALPPSSVSAHGHLSLSLNLPRTATAGDQIPFSWSGRNLGPHHRLVLQKPEGTAHTWRTIMPLRGNSGHSAIPLLDLGKYRLRIADLMPVPRPGHGHHRPPHFRVIAHEIAAVAVFGEVSFSTLFRSYERVHSTPHYTFPYAYASELQYASGETALAFSVEHNHCSFVHIAFVGELFGVGNPGGSNTITVIQESREPVSASTAYEVIGSLDAVLVPGQSWALNISSTEEQSEYVHQGSTYINGYAVCDSREPFN